MCVADYIYYYTVYYILSYLARSTFGSVASCTQNVSREPNIPPFPHLLTVSDVYDGHTGHHEIIHLGFVFGCSPSCHLALGVGLHQLVLTRDLDDLHIFVIWTDFL